MSLNSYEFLHKMQARINFPETDKSLLNSQADWGKEVAPDVEKFYAYLGSDPEMNAIFYEFFQGDINNLPA